VLRAFVAVLGSVWWMWVTAQPAQAYEDQASIDAELHYGHAVSDTEPAHGAGIGLGASLGLDNVLTFRGQLSWSLHPHRPDALSVFILTGELLYVVDVLEIVPYFGVGLDGVIMANRIDRDGAATRADFGVHPVLGVDWLLSRELAVGLQIRSVLLLTALDRDPLYLKAGATLSYLLDLF
jgi:hypothetical protein